MRSVELFAGAGGLALGTAYAGFRHEAVIEWNQDACDSLRENQVRRMKPVADWPEIHPTDVRSVDFSIFKCIDLLSGGPPCQPFSIGGKHRGPKDQRNLFPEVVRAVRETNPKVVLIENVKGLLRESFADFFEYVVLQLRHPELTVRDQEDWLDHLARLERHHSSRRGRESAYRVFWRKVNAADYGVPQKRERVFIVAFRSDLSPNWSFPVPTHSQDRLLYDQWVTGSYWDQHEVSKRSRPCLSSRYKHRIAKLKYELFKPPSQRWITIRDAFSTLPNPRTPAAVCAVANHEINPGAKVYPGHTGSPLDEPAKTLKAGAHGVPGGENMLAYPNGKVRYFTIRESARLQTFPDNFVFRGAWTEAMRQLGNAVPVTLAKVVAASIADKLRKDGVQ